jgi:diguanylate cyclase (GGDEF)-like protein
MMKLRTAKAGREALPSEMVSLSERLSHMLAVRAGCVAVIVTAGMFGIRTEGAGRLHLLILSALYLMLALAIEGLRRLSKSRGLLLIGGMLLVDGVYLGWSMYTTGGAQSPLRFLLYIHLVAVTLLASYRTGLKIALWHSLLVFVGYYSQLAGFLDPVEVRLDGGKVTTDFHRLSVYNVMAFWVVAIGTTAFSSLNEKELRRRGVDLESLAEMAAEMDNVNTTSDAARCLTHVAGDTFQFPRVAVVAPTARGIEVMSERGCDEVPAEGLTADPLLERAWMEHAPLVVDHLSADENPALAALFPHAGRMIIVPLFAEGAPVGALVGEESARRRYRMDGRALAVVEQFASHGALALSNVRLLEQVQRAAETDALTGLANRTVFDEALAREIGRSARSGESLGLVMMDIDHFKTLNDTHGHQVGDDVLRALGQALDEDSRDFDTVARYGGEEFVVILPGSGVSESRAVAERLRVAVERLDIPTPITASFGVACLPLNAVDAAGLVAAADRALYESKRLGRNRVTVSTAAASPNVASGWGA